MNFDLKFMVMKLSPNIQSSRDIPNWSININNINVVLPNVVLDLYISEYILMNILLKCGIVWHIVDGRYNCILVIQTAFFTRRE